jgi:cystathionine beta-synthase
MNLQGTILVTLGSLSIVAHMPALDEEIDVSEAYRLLLSGTTGIIVTRSEVPIGVITRADLINHWVTRKEA